MSKPFDDFGKYLFNRPTMKERLPKPVYAEYIAAMKDEGVISRETADAIAHAMKTWAMELGATHYCHWFQPLNGKTAEKHDSFLQPDEEGKPITRLSGKSLIKGETDGSSFPNGGLRDTFEARGYTFWDTSSYAFVREHVLYIPSIFMSYRGEKLDLKMPLLRARRALNQQATRVLHLLGRTEVEYVEPMLGLEQEYFLVDRRQAAQRPDLKYCGRALFSADMPKGGDYQDTYFRRVSESVSDFMREVNQVCWSLGIYATVEHNEVAPGQYEFSSIFGEAIPTVDQNMIVMDVLQRVAHRHGFECLLHEKPFSGMNGSGKHNNFSLIASDGDNLFDPGDQQPEDLQFLVFISAFVAAVDRHQLLLRMACCDEGNDHRLGGNEAPPVIMSINMGTALHHLFEELAKTTDITPVKLTQLIAPAISFSNVSVDATDRNRTSPVSFTGNRFELRMLGSSMNASSLNTFLFSALAESLEDIADRLEGMDHDPGSLHASIMQICHDILHEHERILFDGDGYSKAWEEEADRRGLKNCAEYYDSIDALLDPDTIRVCEHFDVLNKTELIARRDVLIHQYTHSVKTQARILTRMAQEGIYPALLQYQMELEKVACTGYSQSALRRAKQNAEWMDALDVQTLDMTELINQVADYDSIEEIARGMKDQVRPKMEKLTRLMNEIELNTPSSVFPYPTQDQLVIQ
ncbi:MAG: glutamine synthetase III [Peptoniphilaceae bacterium]|nr:glutamine synthetase III [Peptoniphilaceae bacterium]MDY5766358.1 glutamine synthetase III [Peptoniphilaceae bacterium]